MQESKPVSTPMDTNKILNNISTEQDKGTENIPYQEAIGALLYLSQITRQDISYAIYTLSAYNNIATKIHWQAVKRVFRYLQGTKELGLEYNKEGNNEIFGYCDADWANDEGDRKSITGYVFILQGGAISWSSKKQHIVALLTCEAEYMSLAAAVPEALCLRKLIQELDPASITKPTLIYMDNRGAIDLAHTSAYKPRTKHIDVRYHFIKENIEKGNVTIKFIGTKEMLADSLTKALPRIKHDTCTNGMGVRMLASQ
ncbi:uncharacterized protein [Neodiprion pinetum]|uniref:uncharacterized protein n=1 Tax=Neodiprion pinetum TaxID=441929 RepID=UPI003712DE78